MLTLKFLAELGTIIGHEILHEAGEFRPGICIYPGAFKPPHKGHFEAVRDIASRPYITQTKVIISPKERQGITAQQSLDIWNAYLQANPIPNVSVKVAKEDSPIKDAMKYISSHPKDTTVYVAGSADEIDDQNYFTGLKSTFGDRVVELPVDEKFGGISASKVRDTLRAGDYKGFKKATPEKVATSKIFNDLTDTIQARPVKENIESSSVGSDIVAALTKFANWCQEALEIKQLPQIEYIDSPTFTRDNKSFGGYNPSDNSILLSIYNRNPVDIMRTLAHELVHCKQNENGGLTSEDGKTGSDVENEANAVAGMIMRVYGKKNPEVFEEGAPGTFKAKITKTYGGQATIEKAKKFKARKNATTLDKKQANWFINMHSKNEAVKPKQQVPEDEIFSAYHGRYTFNVTKAYNLINNKEVKSEIKPYSPSMMKYMSHPEFSAADPEKVAGMEIDYSRPLGIYAKFTNPETGESEWLLIDGNHRVRKASQGKENGLIYVIQDPKDTAKFMKVNKTLPHQLFPDD